MGPAPSEITVRLLLVPEIPEMQSFSCYRNKHLAACIKSHARYVGIVGQQSLLLALQRPYLDGRSFVVHQQVRSVRSQQHFGCGTSSLGKFPLKPARSGIPDTDDTVAPQPLSEASLLLGLSGHRGKIAVVRGHRHGENVRPAPPDDGDELSVHNIPKLNFPVAIQRRLQDTQSPMVRDSNGLDCLAAHAEPCQADDGWKYQQQNAH